MTQNETDRETDQIKRVLSLLARRSYICKSELRRILSSCRANSFTLEDIESLMYSVIDDRVSYIDDSDVTDPFRFCVAVQEEIRSAGYADLFQLLSVREGSTLLEITEAYNRMQSDGPHGQLCRHVGILIENEALLDIYKDLCCAQNVLLELSLRKQFGLFSITKDEKRRMVSDLVKINITSGVATKIIDGFMHENGIYISEEMNRTVAETQNEAVDEFLIPIRNNSEQNKKGRMLTNGIQ